MKQVDNIFSLLLFVVFVLKYDLQFCSPRDIYVVYTFLAAVLWMSCTLPEKIFSATESSVKFRRSGSTYLQDHGIIFVHTICLVLVFFVHFRPLRLRYVNGLRLDKFWFLVSGSASLDKTYQFRFVYSGQLLSFVISS